RSTREPGRCLTLKTDAWLVTRGIFTFEDTNPANDRLFVSSVQSLRRAASQNSKVPLPRRANTFRSTSVPRTALQRPHFMVFSNAAFPGSVSLIDKLRQLSQTTLKLDRSFAFC